MVKYKKIYFDYYKLAEQDYILCEICNNKGVDIHHLIFKSRGGKDNIENLICLCRECHIKAHDNPVFNQKLINIKNNEFKQ